MNISDVKNSLSRKLTGASLDDIQGVSDYSLFKEAAGNLIREIDPLETVRIYSLPVYDGIYDYASPTDLKAKKIIDARPQVNRDETDSFNSVGIEDFDKKKEDFTLEFRDGTKVLRFAKSLGNSTLLFGFEDTNNWSAGGGGSNLTTDSIYYTQGSKSFVFDVGATGGHIEGTFSSVDLSTHENKSSLFVRVYIPDASIVSSVSLRFGSSASAYFSVTATTPHVGSFYNGWQWVRFDWNGATETGTVTTTAITYARVTVTTTSADTDLRVDELRSILPSIYEFPYYSRFLFRNGTTFKEIPTSDTDILNLENPADELFITECAIIASREKSNFELMQRYVDYLYGLQKPTRVGAYDLYRASQPSEGKVVVNSYYEVV